MLVLACTLGPGSACVHALLGHGAVKWGQGLLEDPKVLVSSAATASWQSVGRAFCSPAWLLLHSSSTVPFLSVFPNGSNRPKTLGNPSCPHPSIGTLESALGPGLQLPTIAPEGR